MTFQIDIEALGVYCTYEGASSMHEVLMAVEEIAAHPKVDCFRYVIHDCSRVGPVVLQDDSLTMVSAQSIGIAFSNTRLKGALISTDAAILQALAKYSKLTGRPVEVFGSEPAARAWAAGL